MTLEFKRDLSSPEGALRTIVAFANTAGGALLVGVEDKSRHVRGVRDPLDLEERLANLISDHIVPRLVPELEILPWRRTQVLAVHVYPSPSRPHYLKREGLDGGVYVRVGSTNRRADRDLVEELRRFARGEAFDEQPMPRARLGSSGLPSRFRVVAPVRRLGRADLETLGLAMADQGRKVPTDPSPCGPSRPTSAELPSACRSSTTASRSRTRASCLSALAPGGIPDRAGEKVRGEDGSPVGGLDLNSSDADGSPQRAVPNILCQS